MTDGPETPRLRALAAKLQRIVHEQAVTASPLFSVAHWEHNAGREWPEQPDDDSYFAFENCVHPDCVLIRAGAKEPERTLNFPTLKYTVADKGRCIVCGANFRTGEQVYRDIEPDTWRCLAHGPWLAATSAGAAPQRQTIERHLDYLREAMREALRLSKDAPDEDIIDQAGEQAEWLSNYEKHMTAIAAAAGVRLNGSECQWSDMSREVIAKLASAGAAPGEAKVPRCTECGAIVSIVHTCFPKVAAHGAGRPQIQVGCERPDGTLNIHAESETCAECHPVVSPASDPQTEKR